MQESMARYETEDLSTSSLALAHDDTLELGSFIAALCEETEDEFDVDLRVRAFLESVWFCRFAGIACLPETTRSERPILEN